MELVREHLIYKDIPICICLKKIPDHYEIIRCLLATRTNGVSVCCTDSANIFVQILVKKLDIQASGCSEGVGNST